jgi:hypothetical protein
MSTIKKPVSLFLVFAMFISIMWVTPVVAEAALDPATMTFEEYIVASVENFVTEIEIIHYVQNNAAWLNAAKSDYHAFIDDLSEIIFGIFMHNPQLFHVVSNKLGAPADLRGGEFTSIRIAVSYKLNSSEYTQALRRFDAATADALAYASHAENEFEKALFLHDYIVLNTAYDVENLRHIERNNFMGDPLNPHAHDAYGVLVLGKAVCEGYAVAYHHLLSKVGVESKIITGFSGNIPHAWNLVRIDGQWYHVDSTWNDPLTNNEFDMHGLVSHKHFLLSTAELNQLGHSRFTLPAGITANSTIYDNAFFRNIDTAIIKIGGFYYWIDSTPVTAAANRGVNNNHIRRYNISTRQIDTLHSFESIWYSNGTEFSDSFSFSSASFSRIAAHSGILYFNSSREILSLDPATGAVTTVHTPANLGGEGNRFIFGMTIRGDNIILTIKTQPAQADNLARFPVPVIPAANNNNNDNTIVTVAFTTLDALTVLRAAVGLINLTEAQMTAFSIEGTATTGHALAILRKAVGL